uniref:Ig-like domain-containing protein n=1 Tax=Monodelphis domestica TaxID=13616 RepID=K7E052_MONDO
MGTQSGGKVGHGTGSLKSSKKFTITALGLLLRGTQGQKEPQLLQPKDLVTVTVGEVVTLNCTVTDAAVPGPVKWFKGTGLQRKEIYNFKGGSYPRIKAVVPSSNTDFSISISNITPEDTGTYYCVKFKRGNPDTEFKSGGSTKLIVRVKPSIPLVSSLSGRTNPNKKVNFTCMAMRFFPRDITVKWFKNGNELSALQTNILPIGDSITYNVTSDVQVLLTSKDILSQVTCEVMHSTLQNPLRGTKNLSHYLRVPPEVTVSTQSAPLNLTKVTCHVKRFYPPSVKIIWQENGYLSGGEESSLLTENTDGTYTQESSMLVNTFVQKEERVLICQVAHDLGPLVSASETLRASYYLVVGSGLSQATRYFFIVSTLGMKILFLLSLSTIYILRKHRIAQLKEPPVPSELLSLQTGV